MKQAKGKLYFTYLYEQVLMELVGEVAVDEGLGEVHHVLVLLHTVFDDHRRHIVVIARHVTLKHKVTAIWTTQYEVTLKHKRICNS